MSKIDELKAMKKQYEDKIKNEGAAIMKAAFEAFFAAHPTVLGVRWRQYTPFFNDGDECVFGVHAYYDGIGLRFEGEDECTSVYDREDEDKETSEEFATVAKAACAVIGEVPSDVMKAVFGDHAEVTATRAGFDVEEYSHD